MKLHLHAVQTLAVHGDHLVAHKNLAAEVGWRARADVIHLVRLGTGEQECLGFSV